MEDSDKEFWSLVIRDMVRSVDHSEANAKLLAAEADDA